MKGDSLGVEIKVAAVCSGPPDGPDDLDLIAQGLALEEIVGELRSKL
jgi:hypothetical protein